eukprot:TRINITY_DN3134_c0_g1_i8.p1 TRINITY_DN3134_c0_g1~~TRINITY_DN3134_c0_g1_i8.p1  ORF type:complete len:467 (-),score=38.29 TRINITY_DN3134_c0_g1_i8:496-1896(-)
MLLSVINLTIVLEILGPDNYKVQGQACHQEGDSGCFGDKQLSCPTQQIEEEIAGRNSIAANPCNHQYLVSLQEQTQEDCFSHICGGALVTPKFVITAAHCIFGNVIAEQLTGTDFRDPLFVAHTPRCRHQEGFGRFKIVQYWIHEEYNDFSLENDIAILELENGIEITTYMDYDISKVSKEIQSAGLSISGWGGINAGEQDNIDSVVAMRTASNLQILDQRECKNKLAQLNEFSTLFKGMMCAEGDAADACIGDSGGPLFTGNINSKIYLLGVISFGARRSQCSTNDPFTAPGVYTNVSFYKTWIDTIIPAYQTLSIPIPPQPPQIIPIPTTQSTRSNQTQGFFGTAVQGQSDIQDVESKICVEVEYESESEDECWNSCIEDWEFIQKFTIYDINDYDNYDKEQCLLDNRSGLPILWCRIDEESCSLFDQYFPDYNRLYIQKTIVERCQGVCSEEDYGYNFYGNLP